MVKISLPSQRRNGPSEKEREKERVQMERMKARDANKQIKVQCKNTAMMKIVMLASVLVECLSNLK